MSRVDAATHDEWNASSQPLTVGEVEARRGIGVHGDAGDSEHMDFGRVDVVLVDAVLDRMEAPLCWPGVAGQRADLPILGAVQAVYDGNSEELGDTDKQADCPHD